MIPKPVRDTLGVGPRDLVEFEIREGEVLLRRAATAERIDPFAVFHEWASEADADAFAGLAPAMPPGQRISRSTI